MYKCGWNGCEKAYGTLNHLNAHVTMQSHGSKRTPEGKSRIHQALLFPSLQPCPPMRHNTDVRTEFKEIRKEWKARKKEEENARKADEERARQAHQAQAQAQQGVEGQPGEHPQAQAYQQNGGRPSLPPIAYGGGPDGQQQGQYGPPPAGMVYPPQGNGQIHYQQQYPNSPYGQQGQVYQPRK